MAKFDRMEHISAHFHEAEQVLKAFSTKENFEKIALAIRWMSDALNSGGTLLSCGNGGSMCDAMHFAEELSGRYRGERKALRAIALSDPGFLSCVGNDYGYDSVFARGVEAFGDHQSVLLALSTSGNSSNVIAAIEKAQSMKMKTIALTGKTGGKISGLVDLEIRAPHSEFADRAQEIHIKVIHALIDGIEKNLSL